VTPLNGGSISAATASIHASFDSFANKKWWWLCW